MSVSRCWRYSMRSATVHILILCWARTRQIRDAGHRPVFIHDLDERPHRLEPGQAQQVNRALRLPRGTSTPPSRAIAG